MLIRVPKRPPLTIEERRAKRIQQRKTATQRRLKCPIHGDGTGGHCDQCRGRSVRLNRRPRPPWDLARERALQRALYLQNFWPFFLYGFGAGLNPKGEKWIDESVHKPLADWFEKHCAEWLEARAEGIGMQKHLAVIVHREVGKTTMMQALLLWLHLHDPELSTYIGSESTSLSSKILSGVKGVLDGSDPYPLWTRLYGSWSGSARSWSAREITHAARRNTSRKEPSIGTFAVETSIVGSHPDVIFYDDPISYERLETDVNWISAVNSQVSSLIPVVQSDGLVVWTGTRYDPGDHFGKAFESEGVASLEGLETDSIEVDPEGKWHVYFLAGRDKDGVPTTPKVWPESRLKSYAKVNPLRYASQVMNDPSISEHNPITKDQLNQCKIGVKDVPWSALRFAVLCDTAFWGAGSDSAKDETVFEVWGYPRNGSGDVYFIEGYGSRIWRAEDFAHKLVATVQRYRRQGRSVFAITDEVTMAGKKGAWPLALANFFHDAGEPMPTFHELGRRAQKKSDRLVAAASFWVDGHVRVVENGPGADRLLHQMARIGQYVVNPRVKIDWADAAADAFEPVLYHPMRRQTNLKAPWERGATPLDMQGLRVEDFDDSDEGAWLEANPRPPLRNV